MNDGFGQRWHGWLSSRPRWPPPYVAESTGGRDEAVIKAGRLVIEFAPELSVFALCGVPTTLAATGKL